MVKLYLKENQAFGIGHCQLTYETAERHPLVYCLQDQGEKFGGIRLMRCSTDGEPSYPVAFENPAYFERPVINEERDSEYTIVIKRLCIAWIEANANFLTDLSKED